MRIWQSLSLMILFHLSLSAKTYFVNNQHPQSDNSNAGTQASPWKTIVYAVSHVQAGDTIRVAAGTYEGFTIEMSGSASGPIVLTGAHQDSVFIIHGVEFGKSVHHWTLSHFTIHEFDVWGVFVRGENHHIDLHDLIVTGGEEGIHLTWGEQAQPPYDGEVSDIRITDSEVGNCVYTAVDGTPGPCNNILLKNLTVTGAGQNNPDWGADGIAIERGSHIIVEDCYVYDNSGDGIDLNSRDFGGHVEGVLVRRNIVKGNYRSGIKVWGGGAIVNNILLDQGFVPLVIGMFPGTYHILHNTVAFNLRNPEYAVRNYAFIAAYPNDESNISAETHLTLVNNLFAFNSSDEMGGPTGLYLGEGVVLVEERNNVFFSREDGEIEAEFLEGDPWISREQIQTGEWAVKSGQGTDDICSDPDFLSGIPEYDVHLNPSSPAIDSGFNIDTLITDVFKNTRVVGKLPDIGAIEYRQFSGTLSEQQGNLIPKIIDFQNFPNPFNHQTILQFSIMEPEDVTIQLYNLKGRCVYSWPEKNYSAGRHTLTYAGIDHNGQEIASGIYLFLLKLKGVTMVHKILLTR